jgi:hypothetical protein
MLYRGDQIHGSERSVVHGSERSVVYEGWSSNFWHMEHSLARTAQAWQHDTPHEHARMLLSSWWYKGLASFQSSTVCCSDVKIPECQHQQSIGGNVRVLECQCQQSIVCGPVLHLECQHLTVSRCLLHNLWSTVHVLCTLSHAMLSSTRVNGFIWSSPRMSMGYLPG